MAKTLELEKVLSEYVKKELTARTLVYEERIQALEAHLKDIQRTFLRLASGLSGTTPEVEAKPNGVKRRGRRGKLEMGCRAPGCVNRSKGPRSAFFCETHLKHTAKERAAWTEAFKAKKLKA